MERRRKILTLIYERGPSPYKEILDTTSDTDPVEILSDIDTLVFFRFLQHVNAKSKILPETVLELRPNTRDQLKNDPSRIDDRLRKIEHEIPPWHRKRTILTLLEKPLTENDIKTRVRDQFPYVRWPPLLVEASLRILKKSKYKPREPYIRAVSTEYERASGGETLLESHPFCQFSTLRMLKDEFTNEFRAHIILNLVKEHNASGISSGKIARFLQREYGLRGNKRKAVRNTLENMVFAGLLKVLGSREEKEGHVYQLGPTVKSNPLPPKRKDTMNPHNMKDFNETVTQFLGKYSISTINVDDIASINQVLRDFAQCKQDMSMRSPEEWIESIVLLSDCVRRIPGDTWEKKTFRCVVACLLSRLLPSERAVNVLEICPPPVPESQEQLDYNGITREYYFTLTETYLNINDEKAFRSFEDLEKVGWEFFEFLILKGRVEMRKGKFQKALKTFERAEKKAEERERIAALFYKGLAHFHRGGLKDAETAWAKCLDRGCTIHQQIMVSHNVAAVYRLTGDLQKANLLYQELVAAARFSKMKEFEVKSLLGLATVLIDQCSWEKAETLLNKIISMCPKGVVAGLAETNLGVIMERKGELEKALLHHTNALAMVEKEVHPREYGIICCNMGDVYRQLRKTDKAAAVLTEAVAVVPDEATTVLHALLMSLAEVCTDNGEFTKGWELTHTILQERWLDNKRSEAEALALRGKILLCQHKYEKAQKFLLKSEDMFKTLNLDYELIDVFKLLEECCRINDENQALLYREKREALIKKIGLG